MTINLTEHRKYNKFTFKSKKLGIIYVDHITTSNLGMIHSKLKKSSSKNFARYVCTLICSKEEYVIKDRKFLTKHESELLKNKELNKFAKKLINHNLFLSKLNTISLEKSYKKDETKLLRMLFQKDKRKNDQSFRDLYHYAKYGNSVLEEITKYRQFNITEYMESILPPSSVFNEFEKLRKATLSASDYMQRMLEENTRNVFSNNNHLLRTSVELASSPLNLQKMFEKSLSSASLAKKMLNISVKKLNSLNFNTLADALVTNHTSLYLDTIANNSLTASLDKMANAEITGSKYLNSILNSIKLPEISEILNNTNITSSRVENYSEDELVEIKSTVNEYLSNQIPVEKWNPLTLKNLESIVNMIVAGVIVYLITQNNIQKETTQILNYNINILPTIHKTDSLETLGNNPPNILKTKHLKNCRLVDVEITSFAHLRNKPNISSKHLATLTRGIILEVLDDNEGNGWIYVIAHLNGESIEGWIDKSLTISFSTNIGDCDE